MSARRVCGERTNGREDPAVRGGQANQGNSKLGRRNAFRLIFDDEHIDPKHALDRRSDFACRQPLGTLQHPDDLDHRNDADKAGFFSVKRRSIISAALCD
jgi:hypothetical protein